VTTNKVLYNGGDSLEVDLDIWNYTEEKEVKLYVVLAIGEQLYFYPDWQTEPKFILKSITRKNRLHMDVVDIDLPDSDLQGNFTFFAVITDLDDNVIGDLSRAEIRLR